MAAQKTFIIILLGVFLVLAVFLGVWIFKLYTVNISGVDTTSKTVDCVGYIFTVTNSSYGADSGYLDVSVKNLNYAENDLVSLIAKSDNNSVESNFTNIVIPSEVGALRFLLPLVNDSFKLYAPGCLRYALNCKVGETCR